MVALVFRRASVTICEVRLYDFVDIPSRTYSWQCCVSVNEGRLRRIILRKLGKNNVMRSEK